MRSGHGVRALGPRKLRKCAERKVRAKIHTRFRKDCREASFEFSFRKDCREALFEFSFRRTSLLNLSLGPLQTRYKTAYKSHLHRSFQDNNKNLAGSLKSCPILSGRVPTLVQGNFPAFIVLSPGCCTNFVPGYDCPLLSHIPGPLRNFVGSKVACILHVKCVV